MHVLCPSCAAEYEIPTAQLARPRLLRCTGCGTEWRVPAVVEPVVEAPAPDDRAEKASYDEPAGITLAPLGFMPGAIAEPASASPSQQSGQPGWGIGGRRLWVVLWILSLVVIAGVVLALWHWHALIGHRWPPSMRLWQLLPRANLR
ncbi:zinc-ribbon domain-containing protein [Lichenicola sp.]|uniref:zinc-ribbon domain-containing protein n=1 Tax=Lichenicola sp. TaxID=2804529 RepID=UPI003B00EDBE